MSILLFNAGTSSHFLSQAQDVQGQINLDKLSDVTVTAVQNNQILKYNTATNQWENVAAGEIVDLELDDLTDVVINSGSLGDGQFIRYDAVSGDWENSNLIDGGTF